MMKKIFYFLFLATFGIVFLSACSDDDPLPAPNFSGVTVNGSPVTEAIDVPISTEPVALTVSIENVQIMSYEWKLGNAVIEGATGATYQFTPSETGSYTFTVTAKNYEGNKTSITFTVNIIGPYRSGIFFYGTTHEDLAFFNPVTSTFYEGNIYEKANGHMIGDNSIDGGINDMHIYNNKLYILTPKDYNSTGAKISVCDPQTLIEQKTIMADGFDMSSLGFIYNMIPVNENKFYIGYNPMSNNSGIRVLKVNENGSTEFSSTDITETGGALGVDGPGAFTRMLRNGEDILAACGSKIQVINKNDQVAKSIEVDPSRQITDILKGKDGKLYAIVAGSVDKSSPYWLWMPPAATTPASIITIDASTYSITATKELIVDGTELKIRSGMEANGAVASLTSDELFFVVDGMYAPGKVYSYNYANGTITHIMSQSGGTCGKYLSTDKQGMLYIPLVKNWNTCYTSVYRISDKQQMTDIEAKIGSVKGDGGFISTYLFE